MHARSALFDLYGDHLLRRGGWAPVSAVVGLLGSLGISAPTVRTAVSRVVQEGWLVPEVRDQRGYAVTERGRRRLAEAHARIYRTDEQPWDGRWHVVVTPRVADRSARARVGRSLGYLGYGQLAGPTWVAPRRSPEFDSAADLLGSEPDGRLTTFRAAAETSDAELARRVWDLDALAAAYVDFLAGVGRGPVPDDAEAAFVERTLLVHRWRLFLFSDPGLPAEVLPVDWPGQQAARAFDERAAALDPGAGAHVNAWLRAA